MKMSSQIIMKQCLSKPMEAVLWEVYIEKKKNEVLGQSWL
jgi:hypothetical protein